jgi:hypothetical protein
MTPSSSDQLALFYLTNAIRLLPDAFAAPLTKKRGVGWIIAPV